MELALIHKDNLHRVIKAEDEFFYPLMMETPLIQSRFIGKQMEVKLRSGWQVKGTFLGVIQGPLWEFFKEHSPFSETAGFLEFDSEADWLGQAMRSRFEGIRFYSKPEKPPFSVVLWELGNFVLFSAHSESEQEDRPKINYNLIVTNDAIDKLVSYVKKQLPKAQKHAGGRKKARPNGAEKQTRLGKFLRG